MNLPPGGDEFNPWPYAPAPYVDPHQSSPLTPAEARLLTQIEGAGKMVGGAVESAGGSAMAGLGGITEAGSGGLTTPVSGPELYAGYIYAVNGLDNFQAGYRQMITGENTQTFTEQSTILFLTSLGMSKSDAYNIALGFNNGLMFTASCSQLISYPGAGLEAPVAAGEEAPLVQQIEQQAQTGPVAATGTQGFIVDNNLSLTVAQGLRDEGYDAIHVQELFGSDPGDAAITAAAKELNVSVITANIGDFPTVGIGVPGSLSAAGQLKYTLWLLKN